MTKKTLFIFRHGETDWNREGRMQGGVDIPLNERGREQAKRLLGFFQSNPVDVVLSSDLSRAKETAEISAGVLGIPILLDPRLRETNLGDAEGLTQDEFIDKFGEELLAQWRVAGAEGLHVRFPNGESKAEHLARVLAALNEFLHSTPHEKIGVATHGGVMRRLIHHLRPELETPVLVGNCVTYKVIYDLNARDWDIDLVPVCGEEHEIERARQHIKSRRPPFTT